MILKNFQNWNQINRIVSNRLSIDVANLHQFIIVTFLDYFEPQEQVVSYYRKISIKLTIIYLLCS